VADASYLDTISLIEVLKSFFPSSYRASDTLAATPGILVSEPGRSAAHSRLFQVIPVGDEENYA
jgi:hypothetical protein